jgi:arginase
MLGIRSVDPAEREALRAGGCRSSTTCGRSTSTASRRSCIFLERVEAEDGILHVSLDVDFLDPDIAPAVGTTVPGRCHLPRGASGDGDAARQRRVTSLDLVELNPFLDERGRTATLMVDLVASLMGRRIMDRPTRSF